MPKDVLKLIARNQATGNHIETIDARAAARVLCVVDAGLCRGIGEPIPGQMCVEAAVNFALGHPHGDAPECVDAQLRRFKIDLNDAEGYTSNAARAKVLRRIAIAQLGSDGMLDWSAFCNHMRVYLVRQFLPDLLKGVLADERNLTIYQSRQLQTFIAKNKAKFKKSPLKYVSRVSDILDNYRTGLVSEDIFDLLLGRDDNWDSESILLRVRHHNNPRNTNKQATANYAAFAEAAVQVLKKLKVPGTKYLYLTEKGGKAKARKLAVR